MLSLNVSFLTRGIKPIKQTQIRSPTKRMLKQIMGKFSCNPLPENNPKRFIPLIFALTKRIMTAKRGIKAIFLEI